jgi:predicted ATPase
VARSTEWAAVAEAWTNAKAGELRFVLVSGEPGVGKTRLVTEFAKWAHDDGAIVLFGSCSEDGGQPFQPFVEALERLLPHSGDGLRSQLGHAGGQVRALAKTARTRSSKCSRGKVSPSGSNATWSHSSVNCSASENHGSSR